MNNNHPSSTNLHTKNHQYLPNQQISFIKKADKKTLCPQLKYFEICSHEYKFGTFCPYSHDMSEWRKAHTKKIVKIQR